MIEQTFALGLVGSPILWGLVTLGAATLLGTFMLMAAGRWVTGMDVAFGTALGAVLLMMIGCFGLLMIFASSLVHVNHIAAVIASLILPPLVPLVVQVTVISWRLDVTVIGAILITLVMAAMSAAVTIVLMGILVLVILLTGPFEIPIDILAAFSQ